MMRHAYRCAFHTICLLILAEGPDPIYLACGQTTGNPFRVTLIDSKNRAKLSLVFWLFSSAIMNDLFVTFKTKLKMDVKCVYQQWNWITAANYFGTPPANWVHGYLYFEPGARISTKGFRRYLQIVEKWSGFFFFKFNQGTCPWMAFAWNFFGI